MPEPLLHEDGVKQADPSSLCMLGGAPEARILGGLAPLAFCLCKTEPLTPASPLTAGHSRLLSCLNDFHTDLFPLTGLIVNSQDEPNSRSLQMGWALMHPQRALTLAKLSCASCGAVWSNGRINVGAKLVLRI